MPKKQTPLSSRPTCTHTHSIQPPRSHAMFKPAGCQSELQPWLEICKGSSTPEPRWSSENGTLSRIQIVEPCHHLQTPWHNWNWQYQCTTAKVSQQMTVHLFSIMPCLLHHPWNSVTIHQVNNRNLPQTPVVKPPSQMSCIQPEVVMQVAVLKDLTYRVELTLPWWFTLVPSFQ